MILTETEETVTCVGEKKEGRRRGGDCVKSSPSFTTLSTIAIQAGQSQIVVSVLKSGSLVHLHLVQVHPGLCEIGSNQEENQKLIQEQQQLLETLKKHEAQIVDVVERSRKTQQNRSKKEDKVYDAIATSLSEGWSLLLLLLERRKEVLMLADIFYRRMLEFSVSISRVEDLQIRRGNKPTCDAVRQDMLRKSLQVLTSSSLLLHKLSWLQKTEALQRRGGVLPEEQEQEEEEEEESLWHDGGIVARLEQQVETLQDRRRKADQLISLQLQRLENGLEQPSTSDDFTVYKFLDQDLESGSILLENRDLHTGSKIEVTKDLQPQSRSETTGLQTASRMQENRKVQTSGSKETRKQQTGSRSDKAIDLHTKFRPEENEVLHAGSRSDETRKLKSGSISEESGDLVTGCRLEETRDLLMGTRPEVNSDLESVSQSKETRKYQTKPRVQMTRNLKAESRSEKNTDPETRSRLEVSKQLQFKARAEDMRALQTGSKSEETGDLQSESRSEETRDLHAGSTSKITDLQSDSKSKETRGLRTYSRTEETKDLQGGSRSEEIRDLHIVSTAEETAEPQPGSTSGDVKDFHSENTPKHQRLSMSEVIKEMHVRSRSKSRELQYDSEDIRKPQKESRSEPRDESAELLRRTKQKLRSHQVQIQQQEEYRKYCRKYCKRLHKTMQDLSCVAELLDSCTSMDLGSDLQTSRLLECFNQARQHFTYLDNEADYMLRVWETLKGVHERLEVKEELNEEDLSQLQKLQQKVKEKILQSESILGLSCSFHLTAKQLEALLHSQPQSSFTGSDGPSESELSQHREKQQLIQSLFTKASTLKNDICNQTRVTGFWVQQLEARFVSLQALHVLWLKDASRCEQKLHSKLATSQFNSDISQIWDSFKELKKRFSHLKFNYQKRNDRTRNTKAVRNQLQQVELYAEKLQGLRKRLQGLKARLVSEVKDGGLARDMEDSLNKLQKQMEEFDQSVREHQKTLNMTCRLQKAMEEYQMWCDEASATITQVGKFSLQCRSREAVSILYQQLEEFVWPTVPQQEERISQLTELAIRLHGVEEGRRYIEKAVNKHSEMVMSIRVLSDALMELEAKLKVERLKEQESEQKGDKKLVNVHETEETTEETDKNEEEEKELKKDRKMEKKIPLRDSVTLQEAADMCELKETGHTPELTIKHDRKDAALMRQNTEKSNQNIEEAARQTHRNEENRQETHSEIFTSSSCSSLSHLDATQRADTFNRQSPPATAEAQATPSLFLIVPSFSEIQRAFQKDNQESKQQATISCGLNPAPPQDTSAGGTPEAERHPQEGMTEDSMSSDEYESPDDISLPPLAETPESIMVQSDFEEGFCFSSNSIHFNQYCHQYHSHFEKPGNVTAITGTVQQDCEFRHTENCPSPPPRLHSSTSYRFQTGSSLTVQSPVVASTPSMTSSTLCGILMTGRTTPANLPQSTNLCRVCTKSDFHSGSNPVHQSNTPGSCPQEDNTVTDRTRPLESHQGMVCKLNLSSTDTEGKTTYITESRSETVSHIGPEGHDKSFSVSQTSYCPQLCNDSNSVPHKDSSPPQDIGVNKSSANCPQTNTGCLKNSSFPQSNCGLYEDIDPSHTRKERLSLSKSPSSSPSNHYSMLQENKSLQSLQENPHQGNGFSESPSFAKIPQASIVADSTLHDDKMLLQDNVSAVPYQINTFTHQDSDLQHLSTDATNKVHQDMESPQTRKEAPSIDKLQINNLSSISTVTQHAIYYPSSPPGFNQNMPQESNSLSSPQESTFPQNNITQKTVSQKDPMLQIDPIPQSTEHTQNLNIPKVKYLPCGFEGVTCTLHQKKNLLTQKLIDSQNNTINSPQLSSVSSSDLHQDSSQSSKQTPQVCHSQSGSLTNTTSPITQKALYCPPSHSHSLCSVINHKSPFTQGSRAQVAHESRSSEPSSSTNISISESNRVTSKQRQQIIYSFHESLTSACRQQCVHHPGMTCSSPAQPTAHPQAKAQTHASVHQANLHVTSSSASPHLLTPDEDSDICQPMAIREEIKITPQIKGPPLPAPSPPPVDTESHPQGKACKTGPPCFTRPLSSATVMEGSPVTLEVEVTGHAEPRLSWCKDGVMSSKDLAPACQDKKHYQFLPQIPDWDRSLDSLSSTAVLVGTAHNSSNKESQRACDIITVDWHTWFGTLCVLLWLLYLIIM